eukprot:6048999-Alexandrium_andersonii.AAC.1
MNGAPCATVGSMCSFLNCAMHERCVLVLKTSTAPCINALASHAGVPCSPRAAGIVGIPTAPPVLG